MKTMVARYPGKCPACGEAIHKGDTINFYGKGHAEHVQCRNASDDSEADSHDPDVDEYHDGAFPPSRATLENDRRMAKRGLSITRFASGAVVTQNSRGRCIDAPCCGCCS